MNIVLGLGSNLGDREEHLRRALASLQRRQIHVQRLFQQALLLGGVGLALGGELQPLEDRVLVRELVDDGLLERDLRPCRAYGVAQLLGIEGVEVVGDHGK